MKVLAIGAHPDDIEIACSGTLAKCVKRGDEVTVCHVSTGNLGHVIIPPDELAVIRANEAKKAGSLAGIKVICAGFNDLDIFDGNKASRDVIVDVIKAENPDFIITHNPDDYMPDHRRFAAGIRREFHRHAAQLQKRREGGGAARADILYGYPCGGKFPADGVCGYFRGDRSEDQDARMPRKPACMDEGARRHRFCRHGENVQPLPRLPVRRGLRRRLPPMRGLSERHGETSAAVRA